MLYSMTSIFIWLDYFNDFLKVWWIFKVDQINMAAYGTTIFYINLIYRTCRYWKKKLLMNSQL